MKTESDFPSFASVTNIRIGPRCTAAPFNRTWRAGVTRPGAVQRHPLGLGTFVHLSKASELPEPMRRRNQLNKGWL